MFVIEYVFDMIYDVYYVLLTILDMNIFLTTALNEIETGSPNNLTDSPTHHLKRA